MGKLLYHLVNSKYNIVLYRGLSINAMYHPNHDVKASVEMTILFALAVNLGALAQDNRLVTNNLGVWRGWRRGGMDGRRDCIHLWP